MNKLKYIVTLIIAISLMASAQAQTFYYRGSEKVPLALQPGRKAMLCDAKAEITLPHKGDKLYKTFRSGSLVTAIYDETDSLAPLTNSFKSKKSNCSIYECYYMNSLTATPSGYIHVQLKNLSDTILLKNICEKFDCVIERTSRSYPDIYRIRIIPGEGRNPVNIANLIYETGFFLSAEPIFWVEGLQDTSYDTLTQEQ